MALLALQDVTVAPGGPALLEHAALLVQPGERVAVVGRNGAGKTTLLRLVAGEIAPADGEVVRRQGLSVASLAQEIPRDLYEASAIDGASPWQQVRSITLPLLARTTTLVVVLQIIASLKVFDQMYIMTSGGPNFSTRSALQYIYDVGFTDFRTGYAAAASTLFFLVVLAVSAVWLAMTRRQEPEL